MSQYFEISIHVNAANKVTDIVAICSFPENKASGLDPYEEWIPHNYVSKHLFCGECFLLYYSKLCIQFLSINPNVTTCCYNVLQNNQRGIMGSSLLICSFHTCRRWSWFRNKIASLIFLCIRPIIQWYVIEVCMSQWYFILFRFALWISVRIIAK